jgi:hypothetical protein
MKNIKAETLADGRKARENHKTGLHRLYYCFHGLFNNAGRLASDGG